VVATATVSEWWTCEQINKMEFQQSQQQQQQQHDSSHRITVGAVFNLVISLISLLIVLLQTMFGLFNPFMTTRSIPRLCSLLSLSCKDL